MIIKAEKLFDPLSWTLTPCYLYDFLYVTRFPTALMTAL